VHALPAIFYLPLAIKRTTEGSMTNSKLPRVFLPCLVITVASLSACGTQDKAPSARALQAQEPAINWRANPQLPGISNALGAGNPAQPGLYAVFGRMDKGAKFPPHTHPDARLTTVIHGTMYLGLGAVFDESKVNSYTVGSVVSTPANTPHYMWAKDGAVIMQETGSGPTGMLFSP
jgi:hypothetical protein